MGQGAVGPGAVEGQANRLGLVGPNQNRQLAAAVGQQDKPGDLARILRADICEWLLG